MSGNQSASSQPIDFTSGLTPEQLARRYANDEVVQRALPSVEQLSRAALAVHKVCVANSFVHSFFGGFELVMLGRKRGTKGVDVEISKPVVGGVDKIANAFTTSGEFRVLAGNREDALRIIWGLQVGVDVWMRGSSRLPKNLMSLPIAVPSSSPPYTPQQTFLPFFKPKDLLAEKIRCAGARVTVKPEDGDDIIWLMTGPAPMFPAIDPATLQKLLTNDEVQAALKHHPQNFVLKLLLDL